MCVIYRQTTIYDKAILVKRIIYLRLTFYQSFNRFYYSKIVGNRYNDSHRSGTDIYTDTIL